jgi:RND family efflux transporter MFP subunit
MKKFIYPVIVILVILGGYLIVNAVFTKSFEIPTMPVHKGEFIISLNANGSIDAKRAHMITTPRVRGLQVTWLAPEGSMVQAGDPVVQFDATQQLADVAERESQLKIAEKTLERAKQELAIQEKQLTLELKKAERNYNEKKHEAPKMAEEARIELELAQLNSEARLDQIRADVSKAELEVQRARDQLDRANRELAQTTINAPIPGMVVYLEIWKGGQMAKVQEGDSPWPGQGLVNIPDLSEMVVKATVSEVDASKVDSGQQVVVSLDAFPDVQFEGLVNNKSTLARRKEPGSKINVFDVEVGITGNDERIKPGMSASCRVIVERIPGVISVPLEAVFEKEGEVVVYLDNKRKQPVEVGRRNDMEIEIVSGLEGDERICLVDPTLEEPELPGEKATEPELNKGRTLEDRPGNSKSGRRRRP